MWAGAGEVRGDKGGGGAAVARGKRGFSEGGERWQMPIRVKMRMGYIKTQRFERQFSFCPVILGLSNHPSLQPPASEVGGAVCTRVVAGRWPRGRCALPGMDPVPLGQPDHARAHGGRCRVPATGCTHTCSCTEPCSCSCVRHRCSGRARQDGVKSWPLCANRKPGCRGIAAHSVATLERGVHTLLHSTARSRPKA